MKALKLSVLFLLIAGIILVGLGLYFIFIRPSLLSEDLSYMGSTFQNVTNNIPGLLNWLQKVFWVMGGYIFTTGLLTIFISLTSFRKQLPGTFTIVLLSGVSSIGLMSGVNFIIDSDFKWILLAFTLPWIIALTLYKFSK